MSFTKRIYNDVRLFFASLFQGLGSADKMILSNNGDPLDSTMGIHQVKDTQRVAQNLLKGEVTQEVKELRYRDYLVSENSRNFEVHGDKATKTKKNSNSVFSCKKIKGENHTLYNGINDFDKKTSHTIKIEYENLPKFDLTSYCTHFYIDLENNQVNLFFNKFPNKNINTSKAFLNHIERSMVSSIFGGDYNTLTSLCFVSYKISTLKNYLKFTFNNLILNKCSENSHEIILTYNFEQYKCEDLTEKYKVESLDEKYKNKEPKYLPNNIEIFDESVCSECGKVINESEGNMHSILINKFCCSDCYAKLLMEKNNDKNK